jgi:hypothetical protein
MAADEGRSVRSSVVRPLILALAVGLAGLLLTAVVARARGGFTFEIFHDAPPQPRIVQGFARASPYGGRDGLAVREQAYLRLRRLTRAEPWTMAFDARAARRSGAILNITVDDEVVARETLGPEWTPIAVAIAARDTAGAVVGFGVEGARGPAVIGPVVFRSAAWVWPGTATLAASFAASLAIGLLLASAGWAARAAAVAAAGLIVQAVVFTRGLAGEGTYLPWATEWTLVILGAAIAATLILRRSPVLWTEWRAAIVLTAVGLSVHGWVLRHPLLGVGDSLFHQHRFQSVLGGSYFFTSSAPGGEFPYPVALYVMALPLAPLVDDTRWLLRAMALVAHGAAGLALFAAVKRWRSPEQAFWVQVLFLAVPVGYHTLAVAYLTNSVGQSVSVAAMAAAIAWPFDRRPRLGFGILTGLAAIAFLTHFGTFLLLGACLASFAVWRFQGGDRRRAGHVAMAAVAAALISIAAFYGWFGDTYRALVARPAQTSVAGDAPPPVMRREAHQTQYVPGLDAIGVRLAAVPRYVDRYFGWWLLPLAVIGWFARRRRARDAFGDATIAWLAACAVFFVLGHISTLDVRYYLAAYPALAMLGTEAQAAGRVLGTSAGVLAVAGATTGVAYWLAWLGAWP